MKVDIRKLQKEDAYTSYRWRNDSEVFKYTGHQYTETITLECELEWIKKAISNSDEYRCAILVDGHYVGNTYLTGIIDRRAWFHIFIGDRSYWGKGVAKEASRLIIDYGFNILNLNTILLTAHPDNLAAISIYKKLGFECNDIMNGRVVMELKKESFKY